MERMFCSDAIAINVMEREILPWLQEAQNLLDKKKLNIVRHLLSTYNLLGYPGKFGFEHEMDEEGLTDRYLVYFEYAEGRSPYPQKPFEEMDSGHVAPFETGMGRKVEPVINLN